LRHRNGAVDDDLKRDVAVHSDGDVDGVRDLDSDIAVSENLTGHWSVDHHVVFDDLRDGAGDLHVDDLDDLHWTVDGDRDVHGIGTVDHNVVHAVDNLLDGDGDRNVDDLLDRALTHDIDGNGLANGALHLDGDGDLARNLALHLNGDRNVHGDLNIYIDEHLAGHDLRNGDRVVDGDGDRNTDFDGDLDRHLTLALNGDRLGHRHLARHDNLDGAGNTHRHWHLHGHVDGHVNEHVVGLRHGHGNVDEHLVGAIDFDRDIVRAVHRDGHGHLNRDIDRDVDVLVDEHVVRLRHLTLNGDLHGNRDFDLLGLDDGLCDGDGAGGLVIEAAVTASDAAVVATTADGGGGQAEGLLEAEGGLAEASDRGTDDGGSRTK